MGASKYIVIAGTIGVTMVSACASGSSCVKQLTASECALASHEESEVYTLEYVCVDEQDSPNDSSCQYEGLYSNNSSDKHTVWCCTQ